MLITKKALPRRTFLRGLGSTVALPLLDAMVPALKAGANDYLLAHEAFSPRVSLQGMAAYVRTVSEQGR